MTTTLTTDDLSAQAELHQKLANKLTDSIARLQAKRQTLINTGASLAERTKIEEQIQKYSSQISQEISNANELHAKVINNTLLETDLQNAKDQIKKASDKVLKAVDNLDDIRKSLKVVDLFINLGGAIIGGITGNTAAQIKAIVQDINAL